jgi:hypothetical protein
MAQAWSCREVSLTLYPVHLYPPSGLQAFANPDCKVEAQKLSRGQLTELGGQSWSSAPAKETGPRTQAMPTWIKGQWETPTPQIA